MPDHRRRLHATLRDGRPDWYRIEAKADSDVATVDLYDEIGFWGTTAADFVRDLRAVEAAEIHLHVNSPGGDVFEGIAILNALRAHPARVVATVDGIAASAASFIVQAGDEIVMARNSEMMIHDPLGIIFGNAKELRELAARLDVTGDNIASIYAERAGGDIKDWRKAMRAETWYSADEAVEAGLADRVDAEDADAEDAKNRFDLSIFNYAGRHAAPAPHAPSASAGGPTQQEGSPAVAFSDEQLTDMRQKLGVAEDADEATILTALDEALAERAEPPDDPPPALPEGTVAVDSAQLAELRAAAQRGADARARQEREDRETKVNAAVNDGRIAPARREAWLAKLEADPGSADVLASLEPGLIPVGAPVGHSTETDPAGGDNYWFPGTAITTSREG